MQTFSLTSIVLGRYVGGLPFYSFLGYLLLNLFAVPWESKFAYCHLFFHWFWLSKQAFNRIQRLLSKTHGKVVGDLMTPAPLVVRETTNLEDAARYGFCLSNARCLFRISMNLVS